MKQNKITVSAPGKLMLLGEHAVVYNHPCLVTAVDQRMRATVETLDVLEFQLEPEHLYELNGKLQKNDKIIRHMVIIKNPVKIQKERRTRKKPLILEAVRAIKEEKQKEKKITKKVELKEIEKELDEILSE